MADGKPKGSAKQADATAIVAEGRARAVIDAVLPCVDGGRFPVKRVAGEPFGVEAHCFTDGHDKLRVLLRWKLQGSATVDHEIDMKAQSNDVWSAEFTPPQPGRYQLHGHGLGGSLRVLAARIGTARG